MAGYVPEQFRRGRLYDGGLAGRDRRDGVGGRRQSTDDRRRSAAMRSRLLGPRRRRQPAR